MTDHNVFDISPRKPTGDILADALNTPEFVERLVRSKDRGNELTAPGGTGDDMFNLGYGELVQKYGREVADARGNLLREKGRQADALNVRRSTGEIIQDAAATAVSTVTGMAVGGVASVMSGMATVDKAIGRDYSDMAGAAVTVSQASADAQAWIQGFQSDQIKERSRLKGIARALDADDNTNAMYDEIAQGNSEWFSNIVRMGRDAFDATDLFFEDGAVAADMITGGVASAIPSAKAAQGGMAVARGVTSLFTTKDSRVKLAGAIGSALGIGLTESSGTFNDTIGFVMDLTHVEMMNSPQYRSLLTQGVEPIEAQTEVARSTADEAATRQLPAAAMFGLLAVRFNTNPFQILKGKGAFMSGLRDAGGQFFEEGAQGGSSAFNRNLAIQHQVNAEQSLTEDVGGDIAEGALVGLGMTGAIAAPRATVKTAVGAAELLAAGANRVATGAVVDVAGIGKVQAGRIQRTERLLGAVDTVVAAPGKALKGASTAATLLRGKPIDAAGVGKDDTKRPVKGETLGKPADKKPSKVVAAVVATAKGAAAVAKLIPEAPKRSVIDTAGEGQDDARLSHKQRAKIERKKLRAEKKAAALKKAGEVVNRITGNAADQGGPVQPNAAARAIQATKAAASRLATRPDKKAQAEVTAAATMAAGLDPESQTLSRVVRVTAMLETTRVEDLSDKQVLSTAAVITSLRREADSMDPQVRKLAKQVLASKDIAAIEARVADVDLNTIQTAKTTVTAEVVEETLAVAEVNPGNVNPEVVARILKHKIAKEMTADQRKILALAGEIATTLNERRGDRLEIQTAEQIALKIAPEKDRDTSADEKISAGEAASRSFRIEGFKGLPSIGELAAQILQGAQSPDGKYTVGGKKGRVSIVTEQLRKLTTHMKNKVDALNQSIESGTAAPVKFESLIDGKHLVPASHARAANGVVYHANSAGSEANAKRIHSDATKAAEVYNAMVRAYPKLFPGGEITIADLLPGNTKATTSTTAVEASEASDTASQAKPETEVSVVEDAEAEIKQSLLDGTTTEVDETISAQPQIDEKADTQPGDATLGVEGTTASDQVSQETEDDAGFDEDVNEKEETPGPVTEKFDQTFNETGKDVGYESGNDILNLLNIGTNTTAGYKKLARQVFNKLIKGANARLRDVLTGSSDDRSIQQQILDGDDLTHIRDFKNTMLVDPKTGQYDHNLLSIATVAVIDWLSSVRSADPSKKALRKRLELLGIKLGDLTTEEFNNILHGVSPRFVAEALGKKIIRMWNLKVNSKSQMADARGAAEGLVKELLTVLTAEFDFIDMNEIPLDIKGNDNKFITTQTLNVKGLKDIQTEVGLDGQDSVQKLLTPEENVGPSVGEQIPDTPKMNKRGTSELSKTERRAIENQQNTPHLLAKGITGLIEAIGYEVYSTMLGWIDPSFLAKDHPLRNSIEGKNLSIERDWDDAVALANLIESKAPNGRVEEMPVYFRIAVTKAGRHQATGVNSQANKTLRVMVSPTNNTLDMTNQDDIDGFWLTVAQASGLGGKFKVENVPHEQILAGIQEAFNAKYGDAVKMIEEYLETGELDQEAFYEATGFKEMNHIQKLGIPEILNSIYSVASLNQVSRKTNALTKFYVTMGFELDGKTDGPAHMLVNMGQGILTPQDYENLKRVGYFVGDQDMTLNAYYDGGGQDLYTLGSKTGMLEMYAEMSEAGPAMKAALYASARFAAIFGNFKTSKEDGLPEMTRDTIKNPMTQTVYGAGLNGVAAGIAEDMLIEFYREMAAVPKGVTPADHLGYPSLAEDFELLFGPNTEYDPKQDWTHSWLSKSSVAAFTDIVTEGIGTMIAGAAKTVMGEKITSTNDLLVYITNVQTEFMIALYNQKVLAKAEERASQKEGTEGWIRRAKSNGKGIVKHLMVEDFQAIVDEVKAFGPVYDNGIQTLTIGLFSPQVTNQELSSNMEADLKMKSTMLQPEVARVKVIPYLTQGRGDAMVVNEIFGEDTAPKGTMMVHDGLYVPIKDIKKYAVLANEAVMKVWDRDVIGDVVEDFERFVKMVKKSGDVALVKKALEIVADMPYETTIQHKTVSGLMQQLKEAHRQNAARKDVFQVVPKSVDHLAGGAEAAKSGPDVKMDRTDLNEMIADKLGETRPTEMEILLEEDDENVDQHKLMAIHFRKRAAEGMNVITEAAAKKDGTEIVLPTPDKPKAKAKKRSKKEVTPEGEGSLVFADVNQIMDRLRKKSKRLAIRQTIKALDALLVGMGDYKVVISHNIADLGAEYNRARGEDIFEQENLDGSLGWTDLDNKTIYIMSNTHETLAHELMHLATFIKVEDHYSGKKTNDAVPRLEKLMERFMGIDFSKESTTLATAARAAKDQINAYSGVTTPFGKAAALNEFMAWTLTNAALAKDTQKRDGGVLAQMAKTVIKLIQRILGNKIPNSMYNHILFNTLLLSNEFNTKPIVVVEKQQKQDQDGTAAEEFSPSLIEETDVDTDTESHVETAPKKPTSPKEANPTTELATASEIARAEERAELEDLLDTEDSGDGDANGPIDGDGTGGEGNGITPAANEMTNFWVDLIKQKLEDAKAGLNAEALSEQFERYRNAAREAVKKLEFGGFTLSNHQKQIFKAIHMVLATEMRLSVNSSIALNKIYEHVTNNLKPEMFGDGRQAQERYSAVMDLLGDTKNDEGVSDAIAVLLALSQTSDGFRKALDQLPDPQKDTTTDGSLNQTLTVAAGLLMNKAVGSIDIDGKNAKDLLDSLAENLIKEDQTNEYAMLRTLTSSITKADSFMKGAFNTLADRLDPIDRAVQASDRNKATKIVSGIMAGAANFVSSNRSGQVAELAVRVTHMGVVLDNAVFLREFVTEIVGTTKTNAEVVALLDRTSYKVSGIRQSLKEGVPVLLQDAFETHPDAAQWKSTLRVLAKLDFAHIFDLANPERAFRLLKDNNILSANTTAAEARITKAFPKKVADIILEKSKQLAGHMNLKGPDHQLWQNAYAINKLAGAYDPKMTKMIDTLVTLYSLEIADQADKDTVTEMFENDRQATMNLVTYMQALNIEEDMKTISEKARMNGAKGWVPNHAKKQHRLVVANDNEGEALLKTGWVRRGDYLAEDAWSTESWGYYSTRVRQGGNYSQGVLQSIQETYRGVNATSGLSVDPSFVTVISGAEADIVTDEMNNNHPVDAMETLVPFFDEELGVLHYMRYMNPDMVEDFTKPRENLALMLGAWAGRQVEEKMASQFNRELLLELKRIYDARRSDDDGLFVDMSDPKLKDPIFKDTWEAISWETRQQIKLIFGKNGGFMIEKSMVNLSLGYRDPSIMDIWTGKTRMPQFAQDVIKTAVSVIPGNSAVAILSRTEETVLGAVATAKDIIVVRSLIVPYMNTQANVFQLFGRGVGVKAMKEGYFAKTTELERFNENSRKLIELDMNIALAGNDKNQQAILTQQKQVIKDENKRMSIAPLIEAGQYKNISEGITDLDVDLMSGRMSEWLEGQVNKLPGTVQTIAKYGLLSKDTAIYKAANKAVQYGDFLAKSILYDHYLANGLDHETALRKINEEFVNFSILPGRTRTGLEGIGATWFLSFKIRIMKVAMNQLRENPVRALITAGTVGDYGSPGNDNLVTVAGQGRLGFSLGWEMLLGAPELNPYVNLLSLDELIGL